MRLSITQYIGLKLMKLGAIMAFSKSKARMNSKRICHNNRINKMIATLQSNKEYIQKKHVISKDQHIASNEALMICLKQADRSFTKKRE